ncbi:DNA-repair protein Xrcc1 N-terminal [Trinorchestia longiramus]|nr:DNA-repair protein Xrcc1 N-terminal [Trinorchestia longiramus]
MPLIKNITAISYSSQDPKHPLSALLQGTGAWLCSPNDRSGRLSADLQLERALKISYIDVGNHNSVTLSVEVSRSCSSSGTMCALLPTVALMTPLEFRGQHRNCKAVRMFRAEDLDKRVLEEQWDRVRVTCCQPFKRGVQFGLAFFKLYTSEVLQLLPLYPPLSNALIPPPPSSASLLPNSTAGSSNFATTSDPCATPILECKQKIQRSKTVLSDENILQRLNSSSPCNFSFKKNLPPTSASQSKNSSKYSSTFVNNLKDLERKTINQQSSSHADQMKENRTADKSLSNSSDTPRSAVQKFRSTLEKLCANQTGVSPTVVAKQNFMKKFGSSSAGGGDGQPSEPPTSRIESCVSTDASSGRDAAGDLKVDFEYEALEFIISLALQKDQILQLKVSDVRMQFEAFRGEPLSRPERLCFKNLALDYCARRLDTLNSDSQSATRSRSSCSVSSTSPAQSALNDTCSTSGHYGAQSSADSKSCSSPAAAFPSGRLPPVVPGDSASAGAVGRQPGIRDTLVGASNGSRRSGSGSNASPGALPSKVNGCTSAVVMGDLEEPKECNAENGMRTDSSGKFTFRKLVNSPSTSCSSPASGPKQPRFKRITSTLPMPFYDDFDCSPTRIDAGKLKGSAVKNSPKIFPKRERGQSAKKRKKEEPKPVADGEWVQSKKVRTRVSNSPRNVPPKGDCDVVEIIELDDAMNDCSERQNIRKPVNNSPVQNNGGWLKMRKSNSKYENNKRECSGNQYKLVFTGDTDSENLIDVNPSIEKTAPNQRSTATSGFSSVRSTDTDTCEDETRLPSSCSTDASSAVPGGDGHQDHSQDVLGRTRDGETHVQTEVAPGFRLGAVPANKFGLRTPPPSRLEEVEEESVECPICSQLFPSSLIEEHAATCD